jgi:hypothetical protein
MAAALVAGATWATGWTGWTVGGGIESFYFMIFSVFNSNLNHFEYWAFFLLNILYFWFYPGKSLYDYR